MSLHEERKKHGHTACDEGQRTRLPTRGHRGLTAPTRGRERPGTDSPSSARKEPSLRTPSCGALPPAVTVHPSSEPLGVCSCVRAPAGQEGTRVALREDGSGRADQSRRKSRDGRGEAESERKRPSAGLEDGDGARAKEQGRSPGRWGRGGKDSPGAPTGRGACRHLDSTERCRSQTSASKTRREDVSAVPATSLRPSLLRPQDTNAPPRAERVPRRALPVLHSIQLPVEAKGTAPRARVSPGQAERAPCPRPLHGKGGVD